MGATFSYFLSATSSKALCSAELVLFGMRSERRFVSATILDYDNKQQRGGNLVQSAQSCQKNVTETVWKICLLVVYKLFK